MLKTMTMTMTMMPKCRSWAFVLAVLLVVCCGLIAGASSAMQQRQSQQQQPQQQTQKQLAVAPRTGDKDSDDNDDDCVGDPTAPNCTTYVYPEEEADADMEMLCEAMGYMPGCTVQRECETTLVHEQADDHSVMVYCNYFSTLADVCDEDMSMMHGCESYTGLCHTNGSVVEQCDDYPSIPGLPTTAETDGYIRSMCGMHHMDPCSKCDLEEEGYDMDCDLLMVYSELCIMMPDMSDCAAWSEMCQSIGTWSMFCGSEEKLVPSMLMYFHTGIADYVLFKGWVPQNNAQYAGTIIAIMVFSIVYQGLVVVRNRRSYHWVMSVAPAADATVTTNDRKTFTRQMDDDESPSPTSSSPAASKWLKPQPFRIWVEIQRGLLEALIYGWSLCLMLIAMSFNVGYFFAILSGIFIGGFLFQRFQIIPSLISPCCE